jgi:hypothetical protein
MGGKSRTLYLDARIPLARVTDVVRRRRIKNWMLTGARHLEVEKRVAAALTGIAFEVRQGYKSKDAKRQNADIANAATAYTKGLLPCAAILSLQIDRDIATRYRAERWMLLTGSVGDASPHESVYVFLREIVGYDLAAFFERHAGALRKEVQSVLRVLLEGK